MSITRRSFICSAGTMAMAFPAVADSQNITAPEPFNGCSSTMFDQWREDSIRADVEMQLHLERLNLDAVIAG